MDGEQGQGSFLNGIGLDWMVLESVTGSMTLCLLLLAELSKSERRVPLGQGWVGDKPTMFIHNDLDEFIGWGNCVRH